MPHWGWPEQAAIRGGWAPLVRGPATTVLVACCLVVHRQRRPLFDRRCLDGFWTGSTATEAVCHAEGLSLGPIIVHHKPQTAVVRGVAAIPQGADTTPHQHRGADRLGGGVGRPMTAWLDGRGGSGGILVSRTPGADVFSPFFSLNIVHFPPQVLRHGLGWWSPRCCHVHELLGCVAAAVPATGLLTPLPPCPANNTVLRKHSPNRSVRWTRPSPINSVPNELGPKQ